MNAGGQFSEKDWAWAGSEHCVPKHISETSCSSTSRKNTDLQYNKSSTVCNRAHKIAAVWVADGGE